MKEVTCTNGLITIVDDYVWDSIKEISFYTRGKPPKKQYVFFYYGGKTVSLHRFIMGCPLDNREDVHHKDNNSLNNQRDNLELVSLSAHGALCHRHDKTKTSSKFRCVYWNKKLNKWLVSVTKNNKRLYGGYFIDEVEAAKKANELMIICHNKYAQLNLI